MNSIGIEIIGASGDSGDMAYLAAMRLFSNKSKRVPLRENLLTVAVATADSIRIYTVDTVDFTLGENEITLIYKP